MNRYAVLFAICLVATLLYAAPERPSIARVESDRSITSDDGHRTVVFRRVVLESGPIERAVFVEEDRQRTLDLQYAFDGGLILNDGAVWAFGYEHGRDGLPAQPPSNSNRLFVWNITPSLEFRKVAEFERATSKSGVTPSPIVQCVTLHLEQRQMHLHCSQEKLNGAIEWIRISIANGTELPSIVPDQPTRDPLTNRIIEVQAVTLGKTGCTAVFWVVSRESVQLDGHKTVIYDQVVQVVDSNGKEIKRWTETDRWTSTVRNLLDRSTPSIQSACSNTMRVSTNQLQCRTGIDSWTCLAIFDPNENTGESIKPCEEAK